MNGFTRYCDIPLLGDLDYAQGGGGGGLIILAHGEALWPSRSKLLPLYTI